MEVVAGIVSITNVTIRISSKLWKLSDAWREAPENIYRLRDDITRTKQLLEEIGQNAAFETPPESQGESPEPRADLKILLNQGTAALRRIEEIIERLIRGDSADSNLSQDLGKRRKIIWLRYKEKVAALRKELGIIMSSICHLLITRNVRVSAETTTALKGCQSDIQSHISNELESTSERIKTHNSNVVHASGVMTVTHLNDAIESSQNAILQHMDHRLEALGSSIVAAVRQSVTHEMAIYERQLEGRQVTHLSNGAAWASFNQGLMPMNRQFPPSWTCRCPCHSVTGYNLSMTSLYSVMGSLSVAYHARAFNKGLCQRNICQNHPSTESFKHIRVVYNFPAWLIRVSLSMFLSSNLNGSPQLNIRVVNHLVQENVPEPHRILNHVMFHDTEGIKRTLIEGRISVNDVWGKFLDTPLWYAIALKLPDIVRLLLQAGADPYQKMVAYGGMSPIGRAFEFSLSGNPVEKEVARQFPISNYVDNEGFSTLHLRVAGILNFDLGLALRNQRYLSEIDHLAPDGRAPIHVGAGRGDFDAVKLLLAAGANINTRSTIGETALHAACRYSHFRVAQLLLQAGASVDDRDKLGATPLHLACRRRSDAYSTTKMLSLLKQHGADFNAADNDGVAPLHEAAVRGTVEATQFLLKHGADGNRRMYGEPNSETLLCAVIGRRQYDTIRLLLKNGAEVRSAPQDKTTVLHRLAYCGDTEDFGIFTTHRMRGIDISSRRERFDWQTPHEIFDGRNPKPELRRAWERLLASLEEPDSGELHRPTEFKSEPDESENDEELFMDAREEWEADT
ncbi:ankyrin repeat-containing domain protein [Podospora didyma]|uniref:Ankyrin repeat-containing domain protein n=1 Tax=Podospora didyma TaxID=330526 RepID=A0AAE0P870_9PEZI|nr:ankyrin repeat-containing domain protein [Podospora didyma]